MSEAEFEYLGPYRVLGTLGRGGMGTVYKGAHERSGDVVAVKVIATGVANQSRFRRRFEAEIHTLLRLKHPNIVALVGYGEEQGLLFYSMEFVEGRTLHEHLRQHRRVSWGEVIEVGIQTASALKHAHDLGIIHRDLKPANLMIDEEGHLKLTDFGIAKLFGSTDMTAAGSVIGTADYMPPEQAEGKPVTVRSDLYSLGGVLYTLLAGKAPFGGKSVPEVLYSVRYNAAPRLDELVSDVPHELCELVHQLLEKDPQKRPPTALVVTNRLKSLRQGLARLTESAERAAEHQKIATQIGTSLTSLDLSDVEDDELKLTHEEALSGESPSVDKKKGHEQIPLGTHEQQTMIAPAGYQAPEAESQLEGGETSCVEDDVAPAGSVVERNSIGPAEMSAGPLSSGGPSHFTPISEVDAKPFSFSADVEPEEQTDWVHYASIAGMVALLLFSIGAGWWMLRPSSAGDLYSEISAAADSGDDGQLLAARAEISEFIERFPEDPRVEEVQALSDDLELTRWTRVLSRRAARGGGQVELSMVEQGFLDCMRARADDWDLAEQKLNAFVRLFGPLESLSSSEQRLVELAEYAAEIGKAAQSEDVPPAAGQLADLIRAAEKNLDDDRLDSYYQGLILLYGDKPWAQEQIQRIRQKLQAES